MRRTVLFGLALSCCFLFAAKPATNSNYFAEMHWRLIGPFRGGRTVAISGVAQQSNVYYMAPTDGGVWKSTDYGNTWAPIFDGQDTGSIGALAVAPSDPNLLYVGSGEGLQRPDLSVGNGMYKSSDAGKTWQHLGLREGQQIASIAVDPQDPNRLFVAVLGHPYGPNKERGVYRSTDGGYSFQPVLYKDENTGASEVALDPTDPHIVYADIVGGATGALGDWRLVQRSRQRIVQIARRREYVETAHARDSDFRARTRPNRIRNCAEQYQANVCLDRRLRRLRRPVPFR